MTADDDAPDDPPSLAEDLEHRAWLAHVAVHARQPEQRAAARSLLARLPLPPRHRTRST